MSGTPCCEHCPVRAGRAYAGPALALVWCCVVAAAAAGLWAGALALLGVK